MTPTATAPRPGKLLGARIAAVVIDVDDLERYPPAERSVDLGDQGGDVGGLVVDRHDHRKLRDRKLRSGAPARAAIASAFDGPALDGLSGCVILGRIVSRPPVAVVARGGTYFEPCIYSGT